MNLFSWFRTQFTDDKSDNDTEREEIELTFVRWTETEEREEEVLTEKLVWPAGAERTVEHVPYKGYHGEYVDIDGGVIIDVHDSIAYSEVIDRKVKTVEREVTKSAWVTEVPPSVETVGRTKTVYEGDSDD